MKLHGLLVFDVLLSILTSLPILAQETANSEPDLVCSSKASSEPETFLVSLPKGLSPGTAVDVELVVRLDGVERFRERQHLIVPSGEPVAFASWLGGLSEAVAKESGADITLGVDGVPVQTLTLTELAAQSRRLSGEAPALAELDAGRASRASVTTFTCPNNSPFCEDQYDYCYEVLCEFGNRGANCIQVCATQVDKCVFGDRTTYTTKTLQATRPLPSVCAFYPWYNFLNPKTWTATEARYLNQQYESIYCQPTGETFVSLINQWTSFPICYSKTNFGCSGSAFDLSGDCRW